MATSKKEKGNSKAKAIFIVILVLIIIGTILYFALKDIKVKNIFVINNNILSDKEIIELAELDDYPNYFGIFSYKIKNKLKQHPLIKDVKVNKNFFCVIELDITEHKVLIEYNNQMYLDNYNSIDIIDYQVPRLTSDLDADMFIKLIDELANIDDSIFRNISEIKYSPTQYDDSRFILSMKDGNSVYINIVKFEKLNYYNEIYPSLNGKKGTLYLDSGNHFEKY